MHWMKRTLVLLPLLATTPTVLAQDDYGSRGNLWADWTQEERLEAMELGERFKVMIGAARSELMMVKEAIRHAEARGFVAWDPARGTPSPGDKFYAVNRDRTIVLWIVGQESLASGMRLVNSHIDSVRLETKPHPLREQNGARTARS